MSRNAGANRNDRAEERDRAADQRDLADADRDVAAAPRDDLASIRDGQAKTRQKAERARLFKALAQPVDTQPRSSPGRTPPAVESLYRQAMVDRAAALSELDQLGRDMLGVLDDARQQLWAAADDRRASRSDRANAHAGRQAASADRRAAAADRDQNEIWLNLAADPLRDDSH